MGSISYNMSSEKTNRQKAFEKLHSFLQKMCPDSYLGKRIATESLLLRRFYVIILENKTLTAHILLFSKRMEIKNLYFLHVAER